MQQLGSVFHNAIHHLAMRSSIFRPVTAPYWFDSSWTGNLHALNIEGRIMAWVRYRPPFGNATISKAPCQSIPSISSVFECSYSVSKMHLAKFVFGMMLM